MLIALVILVAFIAVAEVGLQAVQWFHDGRDPLRRRVLCRLVVTPGDEKAFSGVLREVGRGSDGHVVFSDCRTIESDQPIAGDVIKRKSQIVTYQQVADAAR